MREAIRNFLLGTPDEKRAKVSVKRLESRKRLTDEQRQELKAAKHKSRRLFLRQAGLATGIGVATVATGGSILSFLFLKDEHSEKTPIKEIFTAFETYPPALLKIDDLYPEVKNVKPKTNGEFQTLRGRVKWFNFSGLEFNPQAAMDLYNYYEGFEYASGTSTEIGKEPIPFELRSRPNNDRVILIVPQDLPNPYWTDTHGGTIRNVNPILSFVKTVGPGYIPGQTSLNDANEIFAVEACQSTWVVSSNSPENSKRVQESVCNSWGIAINYRQKQLPYQVYEQSITGKGAVFGGIEIGLVKFSNEEYNDINLSKEVISHK